MNKQARMLIVMARLSRWTARLLSLLDLALAAYLLADYWPDWLGSLGRLASVQFTLLLATLVALLVACWRAWPAAALALGALTVAYVLETIIAGGAWSESLAFPALALPALLFLGATGMSRLASQPAEATERP